MVAPAMSIGLGIIGAGSVAWLHAEAAAKAGVRVAGICDVEGANQLVVKLDL